MGVSTSLCCCKNSVHPLGANSALQLLRKMTCESCGVRFSFLKKKKRCRECQKDFCSACLIREAGPRHLLCQTCRILTAVPLDHAELMKLRVRELRHFLAQHDVPIDSCTEKTDLVDLIIRMPRQQPSSESTTSSNEEPPSSERSFFGFTPPAFDFTPPAFPSFSFSPMRNTTVFQQSSSPSSRVRTEQNASPGPPPTQSSDFVFNTAFHWNDVINGNISTDSSEQTCHPTFSCDTLPSFSCHPPSPPQFSFRPPSPPHFSFHPPTPPNFTFCSSSVPRFAFSQPQPSPSRFSFGDHPSPRAECPESSPTSSEFSSHFSSESSPPPAEASSPHHFQAPDVDETQESAENSSTKKIRVEDVLEVNAEELTSRQLKEILSRSFVAYRGVCEKAELIERVKRLQEEVRENQRRAELGLPEENLCKICMDAPVDCVLLECGHMLSCTQCGRLLNECPVCRQYVVRVVHTFRA